MTMNATPDHLDDEVLSALLDGDAAGDAGDSDVAAHLRACDRCAARQAELADARTALADAPVEPVDELTRRRLLAGALQAAEEDRTGLSVAAPAPGRARWLSRHPGLVGSAAAVMLAVLVGIPFVIGNDNKSHDADSTLAAEAPSAGAGELAGAFLGDLGDLSDRERLRLRLTGAPGTDSFAYAPQEPGASPAAGAPAPQPVPAAAPVSGGLASTTTVAGSPTAARTRGGGSAEKAASTPSGGTAAEDSATGSAAAAQTDPQAASRDRADIDACVAALLNGPARGGRLTASGTGVFQDRPAIVAVFELSGGRVAFIADRTGCTVRDRFSV